ncbi:uncharacterized protein [Venturia canescens]|nr:uncharacterized protein LOC122416796 isoform X2 [Venturia canescens]XP_043285794.1 uncharacterized protein LOC122416796 isoform X2 [Venturia canescens]XP_043285802.1 uncharacterized protein LOC122416796 isoform X2 [Venturia canescens]
MNSFMRYYAREEFPNVGPGKYNVSESFKAIKEKPRAESLSKKGYSGLARFGSHVSHTEDYPAPGDYTIRTLSPKVKSLKYPFASTAKRKTVSMNKNPGPGMYKNIDPVKRRILYEHSFGGKMRMKLGVQIKCTKRNNDVCELCGKKPTGDYWHLNNQVFLCRPCMVEERRKLSKHTKLELQEFRKLRDCSEIHLHDGTDAKIWLMHPGEIEKWTRQEAYLCAYFKD